MSHNVSNDGGSQGFDVNKILKILSIFLLLYLFLVSIKLMGTSFKMFGKGFANSLIEGSSNPFVGLFIGILATSLVQSSSTVTSIVVGFVGGGMITLENAIPMIMGANIGTSITNTLVSLSFVARKEDFKRALAGATVHDFFNLCAVGLLFPIELLFHPLQKGAVFLTTLFEGAGGAKFTSPLKLIINPTVKMLSKFFTDTLSLGKTPAAIILLILSTVFLIGSLVYLVKIMRTFMLSKAEEVIEQYIFRNDFMAITLGVVLTILVQSSSVTTSLVVPLVGAGILSLQRCYPFTLGANIGTTCTAMLASLATVSIGADGQAVTVGVTAAFAHLMFNILGIGIFYPLRIIPMTLATKLADIASESKIWAGIFVLSVFFLFPLIMIFVTRLF